MTDYLTKPLTQDGLLRILQRWLPDHFPGGQTRQSSDPIVTWRSAASRAVEPVDDVSGIRQQLRETHRILGAAKVQELVELARQDWPKCLDNADAAMRTADLLMLGHLAHRLRGGALQIGAERLAETCNTLEVAATNQDPAQVSHLLAKLRLQVRDILAILEICIQK